jgi:hypothetical protein
MLSLRHFRLFVPGVFLILACSTISGAADQFSDASHQCWTDEGLCRHACPDRPFLAWQNCFDRCERTWKVCIGEVEGARQAGIQQKKTCDEPPVSQDAHGRAYDDVLRDKRIAIKQAINDIANIKQTLMQEYSSDIGAPGSPRDLATVFLITTRETADLIAMIGGSFKVGGTSAQKIVLDALKKARKEIDKERESASDSIDGRTKDILDWLPTFIPGVKAVKDLRSIDAARTEYGRQLERLGAQLLALQSKLDAIGPAERTADLNSITEDYQRERLRCAGPTSEGVRPR